MSSGTLAGIWIAGIAGNAPQRKGEPPLTPLQQCLGLGSAFSLISHCSAGSLLL